MTNKTSNLIALLATVVLINGCMTQQDNVFGEEKSAPDEFAVYSRAPLSLPPNFGLRPPKPGATRPQTVMPRNEAREALLSSGGQAPSKVAPSSGQSESEMSPGINALLVNTGADRANPDIRSLVNSDTAALSGGGEENFVDSVLFWRDKSGLKGAVIDPAVEERRMRRERGVEDVTEEKSGTIIQRRGGGASRVEEEKGFWGSLFD